MDKASKETLGEALPREMARVRDRVMPAYIGLKGDAGRVALVMMRGSLDQAAKAMAEGDIASMIAAYEDLRSYDT